jgi:hypothetical protein
LSAPDWSYLPTHPLHRGWKKPTRSPATGRNPSHRCACQQPPCWTTWCYACTRVSMAQRPYVSSYRTQQDSNTVNYGRHRATLQEYRVTPLLSLSTCLMSPSPQWQLKCISSSKNVRDWQATGQGGQSLPSRREKET